MTLEGSYQVLVYEYVDGMLERRAPYRERHLEHARAWKHDGRLVAGGATGVPPRGAIFVFSADDRGEIERFVEQDPYVEGGLVTSWSVEPWNVVI